MSYTPIPTRSTSDAVPIATDINQLQTNETDTRANTISNTLSGTGLDNSTTGNKILDEDVLDTDTSLTADSDSKIATQKATKAYVDANAGGSGDLLLQFPAGSWDLPSTNYAPLDTDSGTHGDIQRHLFDDTTEEFVLAQFSLPSDLDTAGTVIFKVYGYAVTAAASKNVEFTFYHSAVNDSESWDTAFSSKVSGDLACDATQDDIDVFTFTETISNLSWSASDFVRIKLSRTAPTSDNLSGDYGLVNFTMVIPRS